MNSTSSEKQNQATLSEADIPEISDAENSIATDEQDSELEFDGNVSRKLLWQSRDLSIRELKSMSDDGDLILKPKYQRNFVASIQIASRLVESILLDVPIPTIYLAEEHDSKLSVIDGQQRLTSFISFLSGNFPGEVKPFRLSGLQVLKELNRKSFSELSDADKSKLRLASIHCITIKKESNDDIKFEIFERLNTGATKLNEDELRNTVYRGPYIDLLAELSDNVTLHKLINQNEKRNRFIYRGLILRFLAMSERSYLNFKPSMKQFCNRELRDNQKLGDAKAKEYRERFEKCVELVWQVFGEQAFRRFLPSHETGHSGEWSNAFNAALFDIQMYGFLHYDKALVMSRKDAIREAMLDLMTNNAEFTAAIGFKTSDRPQLIKRFDLWRGKLNEILEGEKAWSRTFPYSLKRKLFDKDPTCALSGQQILHIDDSEVDHIIPYSQGGKTEEKNAQLVLRYFNRVKGANEGFSVN